MHCVDLGESFHMSIYLQNLASIQPRTSLRVQIPQMLHRKYMLLRRDNCKVCSLTVVIVPGCLCANKLMPMEVFFKVREDKELPELAAKAAQFAPIGSRG